MKVEQRGFVPIITLLTTMCGLFLFSVVTQRLANKSPNAPKQQATISINKAVDIQEVFSSSKFSCEKRDRKCIVKYLGFITARYGPKNAMDILTLLVDRGKVNPAIDLHYLAHQIGEETAKAFDKDSTAFLACPMDDYNGGCAHGYFEYQTAKNSSIQQSALQICDNLSRKEYSFKQIYYCYHGIGHGILMSNNYDLYKSLKICDRIRSKAYIGGCWQGVFMESVMAHARGENNGRYYSTKDLFSPCTKLEKKYLIECYENQNDYLLNEIYHNSLTQAAKACLKAGKYKGICALGLGTYTTYPAWVYQQTGAKTVDSQVSEAIKMCDSFPSELIQSCMQGAVYNAMNDDWPNIKRAVKLCNETDKWPKKSCYRTVGKYSKTLSPKNGNIDFACNQVPSLYKKYCLDNRGFKDIVKYIVSFLLAP